MNTSVTDFFGNTAEKSLEPLTTWGWIWHSTLLLAVLAVAAFAGLIFSRRDDGLSWLVAVIPAWFTYLLSLPLYRAVGPGIDGHWWILTGGIFAVCPLSSYVAYRLNSERCPHIGISCLAPLAGMGLAIGEDIFSEHLATIPLGFKTFGILLIVGVLAIAAMGSNSRR